MPRNIETHIWVGALLRRAQAACAMALVAQKGDERRGDVLVRVLTLDGRASVYGQAFSMGEESAFECLAGPVDEAETTRLIAYRLEDDPDLWVIDIEDRHGRHFISESVQNS